MPGLDRVEIPDAAACCGAAGTYQITHADTSAQVLEPKLGEEEVVDLSGEGAIIKALLAKPEENEPLDDDTPGDHTGGALR